MFLVCQGVSQEHLTKVSSNIMGKIPLILVTILPSLVTIRTVVVEI